MRLLSFYPAVSVNSKLDYSRLIVAHYRFLKHCFLRFQNSLGGGVQRKNTFNINWLQAISCRSYSFLKCLFLYSIHFSAYLNNSASFF